AGDDPRNAHGDELQPVGGGEEARAVAADALQQDSPLRSGGNPAASPHGVARRPGRRARAERERRSATVRIWNETTDVIAKLMDVAQLRQRIVGANLANVNTPGYRSRDVKFEELLADLAGGGDGQLDASSLPEAQIVERENVLARADGNTVN